MVDSQSMSRSGTVVLVAGASGTIGRALVSALAARPDIARVRALARRRVAWSHGKIEMHAADIHDSAAAALQGVHVAYYLVHEIDRPDFAARDIATARRFARAAAAAGVRRLIFLGAMSGGRSPHLQARYAVGDALRDPGPAPGAPGPASRVPVPVIELGAAAVIAAGSPVFELVRHLVACMPVVPCPRGSHTRTQPIALADAVAYLLAALDVPDDLSNRAGAAGNDGTRRAGCRVDIACPDVLSWRDMMALHARVTGLSRRFVDLPLAVRDLSAAWVGLVSPVSRDMARQLVRGMPDELVVRDDAARRLFPQVRPMDVERAWIAAQQAAAPLTPAPWARAGRVAGRLADHVARHAANHVTRHATRHATRRAASRGPWRRGRD